VSRLDSGAPTLVVAPAVGSERRGTARKVARGIGEVLITLGLVLLLFAIYEVYGKASAIDARQRSLSRQLDRAWANATASTGQAVPDGAAFARLYVPRLGLHWVVVQGVSLADIADAPGHYPGTAMPGDFGNFSVAGHREPGLFWDMQRVRPGDAVVVETRTSWYVYHVTVNEIVTPHSIEVIAPTPDEPGAPAGAAMLTLTTCNPKWSNSQRMIVHARLDQTTARSAGPPAWLGR
jgi:sortase A